MPSWTQPWFRFPPKGWTIVRIERSGRPTWYALSGSYEGPERRTYELANWDALNFKHGGL